MNNYSAEANHLKNETSPYLKQHMHNPVDWYPWGEEALQKAKDENKLIFLSIGYSTCHWCHVMAHESFEDETVASILNDNYVCIKVDREERPDLDTVYMNACQMMTGSGGWPLNLWLTPEQKPIYAGTYFPTHNQMGRPGFITVLTHLRKLWRDDRDEMIGKSDEILAVINKQGQSNPEAVDKFVTVQAVRDLTERFDEAFGGFSGAPKFPSPHQLLFLIHYHEKHPSDRVLRMITKTLDSMYLGGIYDHVGGGFARYSVDEQWLVPHFEKMLYDNALLLRTYNLGYLLTRNPVYKAVAYDIVRFLNREMKSETGGYYTALDADSEGEEGKYYVFSKEEVQKVLKELEETEVLADAYMDHYNITDDGNFEGKNIPNHIGGEAVLEDVKRFESCNKALLDYREQRIRPSLDYKVLASNNGLLLSSLSHMYRIYGDESILKTAIGIADFIADKLFEDGHLFGTYTKGQVSKQAILDDYAFVMEGYIDLYEATMDESHLKTAEDLISTLNMDFLDSEKGGYYLTSSEGETLISRPSDAYDGAVPSGNSVMALNLMRLSRLKDDWAYQDQCDNLIKRFGKLIKKGPSYFSYLLIGLLYRQEGTKDLVVAVEDDDQLKSVLRDTRLEALKYFSYDIRKKRTEKVPLDGRITYYVCEDFACQQPTFEV